MSKKSNVPPNHLVPGIPNFSDWNDGMNCIVWAKTSASFDWWPARICPLVGLPKEIVKKGQSLVQKKYVIYYFGMPSSSSFDFATPQQLRLFMVAFDVLSKIKVNPKFASLFPVAIERAKRAFEANDINEDGEQEGSMDIVLEEDTNDDTIEEDQEEIIDESTEASVATEADPSDNGSDIDFTSKRRKSTTKTGRGRKPGAAISKSKASIEESISTQKKRGRTPKKKLDTESNENEDKTVAQKPEAPGGGSSFVERKKPGRKPKKEVCAESSNDEDKVTTKKAETVSGKKSGRNAKKQIDSESGTEEDVQPKKIRIKEPIGIHSEKPQYTEMKKTDKVLIPETREDTFGALVRIIGKAADNNEFGVIKAAVLSIRKLRSMTPSNEELVKLGIAKAVSSLRQHTNADLAALAKSVRNEWKQAFVSTSAVPSEIPAINSCGTIESNGKLLSEFGRKLNEIETPKHTAVSNAIAESDEHAVSEMREIAIASQSAKVSELLTPGTIIVTENDRGHVEPATESVGSRPTLLSTLKAAASQKARASIKIVSFQRDSLHEEFADGVCRLYRTRGIGRTRAVTLLGQAGGLQFAIARWIEEFLFRKYCNISALTDPVAAEFDALVFNSKRYLPGIVQLSFGCHEAGSPTASIFSRMHDMLQATAAATSSSSSSLSQTLVADDKLVTEEEIESILNDQ